MIEKTVPVTETYKGRLKGRGGLYFIRDNFLDFWFKFVYPNKQLLEEGKTDIVLTQIKDSLETYLGRKFESFCMELLPDLGVFDITKSGKWWHKGEEIDIVALNEETRHILFVECKWQNRVDAQNILKELKEKARYVRWHNEKRKEYYAIFAKSFKERMKEKNVMLLDLEDVQKILRHGS